MTAVQAKPKVAGVTGGRLIARNTLLNLVGQITPRVVGLAAVPFIVRGLGTDSYGVLSLALVVLGYFSLIDLGLGSGSTKFVAECLGRGALHQIRPLVFTSLAMAALWGVLAGGALAVSSPLLTGRIFKITPALAGEARTSFLLLAFSVPIVMAGATLQGVLSGAQRFDLINVVHVPFYIASFALPAIGATLGFRLVPIVLFLVVVRLIAALAWFTFCLRVFPSLRRGPAFDLKLLRPLATYGSWVTITNVILPLMLYLDRFVIGAELPIAAVAYYTAPYQLASAFAVLAGCLVQTLFPALITANALGNREALGALFVRSLKGLLLALGPLLLLTISFSRAILHLWLGSDFAQQGAPSLRILSLCTLFGIQAYAAFTLLQGLGRPDLPAKLLLCELPLYVGLLWFLVRKEGITGAALATTVRVWLDGVFLFGACFFLKFLPWRALAQNGLWRSLTVLASLGVALSLTYRMEASLVTHALLAAAAVTLYVAAAWRYGLDNADRSFLISSFARFADSEQKMR